MHGIPFCSLLLLLHYTIPSCLLTSLLHRPGGLWERVPKNKREANFPFNLLCYIFRFVYFPILIFFPIKIDRNSFEFGSMKMFINYSCKENSYCYALKIPWSFKRKEIQLSDQKLKTLFGHHAMRILSKIRLSWCSKKLLSHFDVCMKW